MTRGHSKFTILLFVVCLIIHLLFWRSLYAHFQSYFSLKRKYTRNKYQKANMKCNYFKKASWCDMNVSSTRNIPACLNIFIFDSFAKKFKSFWMINSRLKALKTFHSLSIFKKLGITIYFMSNDSNIFISHFFN